ncbi:hypothetical protein [Mycobacterium deserti]|uniref:Uncharacterized protein n=1 Tax=Mycobacterium deserti TaxID=2978347 RepID=A0ABT2MJT3_9MYCO|nr:hypothetical protein [Mycobacterium deserti]MCT7661350.1 hypothetical protein [Mycobacterium deserti]
MTDSRKSQPGDIRAAAQAAAQAAQDLASGALRVPTASAQILAQLPDLIENLAAATERLNTNLDRLERYMALADPTFETIDRLLPQLEALAARGDQAFRAVRGVPGVNTFGRITGLSRDAAAQADAPESATPPKRRSEPRRRKD